MIRRFSLNLSEENVQRFQAICKKGGLPKSTMSHAVNDFLRDIAPVMEKASEKGQFSVLDFFYFLGQQMEELYAQERKDKLTHDEERKEEASNRN